MKKKIIALMGMAVISCALLMGCGSKARKLPRQKKRRSRKRLIQKKLQL